MFNGVFQIITRKKAEELGIRFFFNGKPCRNHGNIWLRNTNRGKCFCPDCKKDRREVGYAWITPEYYEKKKEKARENSKTDKAKAVKKERRNALKNWGELKERHRDKESGRKWRKNNPDKLYLNRINYRARKNYPNSMPVKDTELNDFVFIEAVNLVFIRNKLTNHDWHIDHMIPLAKGGMHSWENIQLIPWIINIMKKDRLIFTKPYSWFDYA